MRKLLAFGVSLILYALSAAGVHAQGTLPVALSQQFAFSACSTTSSICGTPLIGGLLYTYVAGTVATPQTAYQDSGLSIPLPWPIPLDSNGRVPMFYLANGSVHVRLTDANGVVQFDYPQMLVVGASSGSGGGGSVDPTTVASTGDVKFRATGETLTGWVKLNGLTIGSASSGATGRANADTQNLFVYLWTNCSSPNSNNHCPVIGGLGSSALADFQANKQLTLIDLRGSFLAGLDDMGNTPRGYLISTNVHPPDTPTTPNGQGGDAIYALTQSNLPAVAPTGSISSSATTTLGGSATPSGTVTIGGSATPAGTVTIGGSVTPTGTIGGTQSIPYLEVVGLGGGGANDASDLQRSGSTLTINGSNFSFTGSAINGSSFSASFAGSALAGSSFTGSFAGSAINGSSFSASTSVTSSFTGNNLGSASAFNVAPPFLLGSWYIKL